MLKPYYVNFFKKESDIEINIEINKIKKIKKVTVFHFVPEKGNKKALKEWAHYFRKNYCDDRELKIESQLNPNETKEEYLRQIFPDKGSIVRIGDFTEILVADYLMYKKNFMVPRTRYNSKDKRNLSTQGSDVIAYKMNDPENWNKKDTMLVYEVKGQSGGKPKNKLQEAVCDSKKDIERITESMLSSKRKLMRGKSEEECKKCIELKVIVRFENRAAKPCIEKYGAAAVQSDQTYSEKLIKEVKVSGNPDVELLVIHCPDLKENIKELYERALQ